MSAYATVEEVQQRWRSLSLEEAERAEHLLEDLSDVIRAKAMLQGIDYDLFVLNHPPFASVAKTVVISVLSRILREDTQGQVLSQETQTGLGYSWTGTMAIPGGGIANAFLEREWRMLGLKRQTMGSVEYAYGNHD